MKDIWLRINYWHCMGDEWTSSYIYAISDYVDEGQGVIGAGSKNERHMAGGIGNQSVQSQLLALRQC